MTRKFVVAALAQHLFPQASRFPVHIEVAKHTGNQCDTLDRV